MKTHNVTIRPPAENSADQISPEGWFKQTTSDSKGNKTTLLFQRKEGETPRSLGQKISDFFSGIKRAKNSTTLGEAFKGIKEYEGKKTYTGGKFAVNLIPGAINILAPEKKKDELHTLKPAQEVKYGNYTLKLEDQ